MYYHSWVSLLELLLALLLIRVTAWNPMAPTPVASASDVGSRAVAARAPYPATLLTVLVTC